LTGPQQTVVLRTEKTLIRAVYGFANLSSRYSDTILFTNNGNKVKINRFIQIDYQRIVNREKNIIPVTLFN